MSFANQGTARAARTAGAANPAKQSAANNIFGENSPIRTSGLTSGEPVFFRNRQRGATLIEAIASIGVMASVMALASSMVGSYTADAKSAATAQQIKAVGEAAKGFILDNQMTLVANSTATTPVVITVDMLANGGTIGGTAVGGGYLPAGFSAQNNELQTMCVKVIQPAANNLQGIVVTEGGNAIEDLPLRQIANQIGPAGGYVDSQTPTTMNGTQGSWSIAIGSYGSKDCSGASASGTPGAGHNVMAIWTGGNDVETAFIYRDAIAGRPELNQMQTNFDLGGHRVIGLETASVDSACSAGVNTGDLSKDASGRVVSCQGGIWRDQKMHWGEPVSSAASGCSASTPSDKMFLVTGGTTPALYRCNGATPQVVGIDETGNLHLAGNLAVDGTASVGSNTTIGGSLGVVSNTNVGGTLGVASNTNVGGSLGVVSNTNVGGTLVVASNTYVGNWLGVGGDTALGGRLDVASNATVGGTLKVNGLVVNNIGIAGASCWPLGSVAIDSAGALLSCESGVWTESSGGESGAICGMATNGCGWAGNIKCKGVDPACGYCPTGYRYVSWAVNFGDGVFGFCGKV